MSDVVILDCHNLDTALASLAAGIARPKADVIQAFLGFRDQWAAYPGHDPAKVMPREVLGSLGVAIDRVTFDGAYYFHGSRVQDPLSFTRRGILPLDAMIDEIWAELYLLVRDSLAEAQWKTLRVDVESDAGDHAGWLYRRKVGGPTDQGPFGELVRATLHPAVQGTHDYLRTPEIVEDIGQCCEDILGIDVHSRFLDASTACIVKFPTSEAPAPYVTESACWYIYSVLREDKVSRHCTWAFNGQGLPVPPDDVVHVEMVTS